MDIKINLPTEECTCDAKVFYDKYRKQVDLFIQNELEIAKARKKTSHIVVGKKASKVTSRKSSEGSAFTQFSVTSKTSKTSKKSGKKRSYLPKIKGAKYISPEEETGSISVSTTSTETRLPKIGAKHVKKWSDGPSSSSGKSKDSRKLLLQPWQRRGKMFKKREQKKGDLQYSSLDEDFYGSSFEFEEEFEEYEKRDIKQKSERTKKTRGKETKGRDKKKIISAGKRKAPQTGIIDRDQKSVLSADEISLRKTKSRSDQEIKTKRKSTKKSNAKLWKKDQKKAESLSEDDKSFSSFESISKEETAALKLTKTKKTDDFISVLIAKAKKEGLNEDFISSILANAKERGQEADLLFFFRHANEEGLLESLLYKMAETEDDDLNELTTDWSVKGHEKKRKMLITKLIDINKTGDRDENYMVSLIAEAREENPDDELLLTLSNAAKDDNLNNLISSLDKAKKKSQLDEMTSILIKKEQMIQKNKLKTLISNIAVAMGKDESFVKNLLTKAKETDQDDNVLTSLMIAMAKGNLNELIPTMEDADDENLLDEILTSIPKHPRRIPNRYSIFYDDSFMDQLNIPKKTKSEDMSIVEKFSAPKKSVDFDDELSDESSIESIDETLSEQERDIDVSTRKYKKQKLSHREKKIRKSKQKYTKDPKQHKDAKEKSDEEDKLLPIKVKPKIRKSYLEKIKQRILYNRQLSADKLPDVDYDMIERHRITRFDLADLDLKSTDKSREKSDEEEPATVYKKKKIKKKSKRYRESFLKKIYGGRKIQPLTETDMSTTTSSSSPYYTVPKRVPKKKPKAKRKPEPIDGIETPTPTPRKIKKHVTKYAKSKSRSKSKRMPIKIEKEVSENSDVSSFEQLLQKKISGLCEIDGEGRNERGYLVGFRYKYDEETIDWRKKPKKSSMPSESTYTGEDWTSRATRRATLYFKSHKIDDFFHFLGSHLVANKPENPIDYLVLLLDHCIHFRSGIIGPPLLFEEHHIESLYYSMDVFNEGFISIQQYCTGMETLFIKEYKCNPRTNRNNMVLKETFVAEALRRQRIHLRDMLRGSGTIFNFGRSSNSDLGSEWSKVDVQDEG